MKVYGQQELQDGGPKKENALSLMVMLEVTLYTPNIELHITQKHNSNDNVHVCEVSESNAINIYGAHYTAFKIIGNSYHARQTGRLFYLGTHNSYTI